jgi:hypothetical protein
MKFDTPEGAEGAVVGRIMRSADRRRKLSKIKAS